MWLWSRNWEGGRVSALRLMLASPSRATSTARKAGCWERSILLRPPISLVKSFGRNFRAPQSVVWKGALTAAELKEAGLVGPPPPPASAPVVASGSQLVGLRVNRGRFIDRSTERTLSWVPPKTSGIGSETAWI